MGVLSGSRSRVAGGLLAVMCLLAAAFIAGYPGARVLAASGTKPPKEFFAYVEWSQSRFDKAWRYSRLGKEPHTNEGATSSEWEWPCGATTDPNCAVSETFIRRRTGQNGKKMVGLPEAGLEWTSIFPYCESAFQMNCIIGLTIKDSRGTEEGLFIGGNTNDYQSLERDWSTTPKRLSYETYKPFKGDMSRLIPDGGLRHFSRQIPLSWMVRKYLDLAPIACGFPWMDLATTANQELEKKCRIVNRSGLHPTKYQNSLCRFKKGRRVGRFSLKKRLKMVLYISLVSLRKQVNLRFWKRNYQRIQNSRFKCASLLSFFQKDG